MSNDSISNSKDFQALLEILCRFNSPEPCGRFLMDLCTPQELKSLSDRWQVAKLLHQDVPYRKISALTGASTATITRVARSLLHGQNGYQTVLKTSLELEKK
jgi:TrpR-related protein YerC/YecD